MRLTALTVTIGLVFGFTLAPTTQGATPLQTQNEALFEQLTVTHELDAEQMAAVREIFARSGFMGQGNPAITRHPMTVEECLAKVGDLVETIDDTESRRICGDRWMVPLYDPASQQPQQASACIDRFEFPNIPCSYPVVWVRAREAAEVCEALGKRLCDAHEWEGACAGALEPPDYRFDLAEGVDPASGFKRMRAAHNSVYDARKVWAYGPEYQTGICAAASQKSPDCEGGSWTQCGSNTYPTGAFPECRSSLGVYDLHGNAAEHMNLPLAEDQMSSQGSTSYGQTEMKGSWFIFDRYKAHEDACRWRAPYWHGSRVMDTHSHHNYHLGFRCCKTVTPAEEAVDLR
jgi:formylglycine-generating enzyme required for sulfatase activity